MPMEFLLNPFTVSWFACLQSIVAKVSTYKNPQLIIEKEFRTSSGMLSTISSVPVEPVTILRTVDKPVLTRRFDSE